MKLLLKNFYFTLLLLKMWHINTLLVPSSHKLIIMTIKSLILRLQLRYFDTFHHASNTNIWCYILNRNLFHLHQIGALWHWSFTWYQWHNCSKFCLDWFCNFLEILSNVILKVWAFSITLDNSTHKDMSCLNMPYWFYYNKAMQFFLFACYFYIKSIHWQD